jgi:UDP-N-acetyl-D-mannosaminuronate dehydrogenase
MLLIGTGFQAGVGDAGGALSWELVPRACDVGAVLAWDPYVDHTSNEFAPEARIVSDLTSAFKQADVVVVAVDHPELIENSSRLALETFINRGGIVFDACDAPSLRPRRFEESPGLHYWGMARSCAICAV